MFQGPGYLGDFVAGSVVRFKWNAYATTGASVTRSTDGSLRIYKNGSATQRTSAAGITDTEDFDTLTGLMDVVIDLSDNTDAGFYAAGSDYTVVLQGATIDGAAVNAVIAQFSIENRNDRADLRKVGGTANASADLAFKSMTLTNTGAGAALKLVAGATGNAFVITGGSTSGKGVVVTTTNGHAVEIDANGSLKNGISVTCDDGYAGYFAATVASGAGIGAFGFGAGGVGVEIAGGTSAAVGVSIIGGTTSGNGIEVATTSGHACSMAATGTAKAGLSLSGVYGLLAGGSTAGASIHGSTSGVGILASGGSSTGDAVQFTATAGDAIQLTGAGGGAYDVNLAGRGTIKNIAAQTGDSYARLGAPVGASISADIASVKAKTDLLPSSPAAAGDAMALTNSERLSVADALLKRDLSAVTGEASRSPLNAYRLMRNKWSIAAGTLTVKKEDDSTTAWTAAVTDSTSANPITGVDPS